MSDEVYGYLSAGIHDVNPDELYSAFVDTMPLSQSRPILYECLQKFASFLDKYQPVEIWVDGSFVSTKLNPNDIDVVVFMQCLEMEKMNQCGDYLKKHKGIDYCCSLAETQENRDILKDDYYELVVNNRNYWRGQFGFDRKDNPKGIIRLKWGDVKAHMIGGAE